jgi:hypothetical protein
MGNEFSFPSAFIPFMERGLKTVLPTLNFLFVEPMEDSHRFFSMGWHDFIPVCLHIFFNDFLLDTQSWEE